jgi:hypothetical protein
MLSFRPANALHQLGPSGDACPLSLRDVLRALGAGRGTMPVIAAPLPAVMRGALLAARKANAVIGLALVPGVAPEGWFGALARAAHELAPRLPFFASGEVRVEDGDGGVERAHLAAHKLVDAGVTHLAVDVAAVALGRRAQAASQVAGVASEREIAVDCVLPLGEGPFDPEEAAAWVDEFEGWGVRADLVSARLPLTTHEAQARAQLAALDALSAALGGRPILRRGPLAPGLASIIRRGGPRACEDGGHILAAAVRSIPREQREAASEERRGPVDLPEALADRIEALAYFETAALIEAFGVAGTGAAVEASLRAPGI